MNRTLETPILIVGGGPVGLALGLDLSWRGVECALIERTDGAIENPNRARRCIDGIPLNCGIDAAWRGA